MTHRPLTLSSLVALALCACELTTKNLSDPATDGAATDATGSTGAATAQPTEATGVSPLDVGGGGLCEEVLPGLAKDCASDRDCALVFHQTDCCGSLAAVGIDADAVATFEAAEAACVASYPGCGCAPAPTTAEDGGSTEDAAAIVVVCADSQCQSQIPDAAPLQWYTTCGDPVCMGYTKPEGVEPCTPEQMEGAPCEVEGATCDPMSDCNALVVCADKDPKQQEGGCPISRARFKTDIAYLGAADLERYAAELASLKLATYRYREAPAGAPPRLGIILEDDERGVWVDAAHDRVDLYGYASLAVAALQVQQRQIAALQAELEQVRAALEPAGVCAP